MKKFNVIAGLPRSGSTLLCNILNEHPNIFASDTSPMANGTLSLINSLKSGPEYISELSNNDAETKERLIMSARYSVIGWYHKYFDKTIFDKDRSNIWLNNHDSLAKLFPKGNLFITVRDPREIFASILKKREKDPIGWSVGNQKRTLLSQADTLFSPSGLIGSALTSIENLLELSRIKSKQVDRIYFIKYESFVADPKENMKNIYELVDEDYFEHDFNNIKKSSKDKDELYGNLWPHEGFGKVEAKDNLWPKMIPEELGKIIIKRYPVYSQVFGYI